MADYTTEADLIAAMRSETRYRQIAGDIAGSTENKDRAHAEAVDEMESVIRGRYAVPVDAPLPPALKSAFVSLEIWYLAKGMDRRPEFIEENAKAAREYLAKIGSGRATLVDANTATEGGSPTGADIVVIRQDDTFDATDTTKPMLLRMPPL